MKREQNANSSSDRGYGTEKTFDLRTSDGSLRLLWSVFRARAASKSFVSDACGGVTPVSHDLALRRMQEAGVVMTSWIQVLLELQRD
jgi:hypothetical protein